tara:strand:- start:114 stop:629 length:516 start_codon:yes stop_codon:yes gene_type:complete
MTQTFTEQAIKNWKTYNPNKLSALAVYSNQFFNEHYFGDNAKLNMVNYANGLSKEVFKYKPLLQMKNAHAKTRSNIQLLSLKASCNLIEQTPAQHMIKESTKLHAKNLNKELKVAQNIVLPITSELRNSWADYANKIREIYKYQKGKYEIENDLNATCNTCGTTLKGRNIL